MEEIATIGLDIAKVFFSGFMASMLPEQLSFVESFGAMTLLDFSKLCHARSASKLARQDTIGRDFWRDSATRCD